LLFPKEAHLLPLPEDILKVLLVFNVLADNSDPEGVIHGFIEKITVKLNDIWVILGLKKLYCLLLVLVEFVQGFGFNLFKRIKFAAVSMDDFVDLGILFARS
jgi:hypothetical protein